METTLHHTSKYPASAVSVIWYFELFTTVHALPCTDHVPWAPGVFIISPVHTALLEPVPRAENLAVNFCRAHGCGPPHFLAHATHAQSTHLWYRNLHAVAAGCCEDRHANTDCNQDNDGEYGRSTAHRIAQTRLRLQDSSKRGSATTISTRWRGITVHTATIRRIGTRTGGMSTETADSLAELTVSRRRGFSCMLVGSGCADASSLDSVMAWGGGDRAHARSQYNAQKAFVWLHRRPQNHRATTRH